MEGGSDVQSIPMAIFCRKVIHQQCMRASRQAWRVCVHSLPSPKLQVCHGWWFFSSTSCCGGLFGEDVASNACGKKTQRQRPDKPDEFACTACPRRNCKFAMDDGSSVPTVAVAAGTPQPHVCPGGWLRSATTSCYGILCRSGSFHQTGWTFLPAQTALTETARQPWKMFFCNQLLWQPSWGPGLSERKLQAIPRPEGAGGFCSCYQTTIRTVLRLHRVFVLSGFCIFNFVGCPAQKDRT